MAKNKKAASKINSKKKSTKANNSSFKNTVSDFVNYIKLHKVASLLIAVILFGLLIYGGLIVYEKWQFNKAEKALDNLYSDIVKELGEPIETTKDKSCAYSSAKYSQGTLGCGIHYTLSYEGKDRSVIMNDLGVIGNIIDGKYTISEPYYEYTRNSTKIDDFVSGSYTIKFDFINLNCGVIARVESTNEASRSEIISIGCGKSGSLSKIYPSTN